MIVCFRVDSSVEMGVGHVVRCLALAVALRKRGAKCFFICREHKGNLLTQIRENGFEVKVLTLNESNSGTDGIQKKSSVAHAKWLGAEWEIDAEQTIDSIGEVEVDWLVIDHYAIDIRWESNLRHKSKKIFVIDDIADRQHDCDVLLDQNIYSDMEIRYFDKVSESCQLLLGPRYALLRDEFKKLHEQVKPRSGYVKRLLVFFGGGDAKDFTGKMIKILSKAGLPEVNVDVVIGAQHPSRKRIETECLRYGFECYVQTDQMGKLMAAADLAIGAGGSACWERCCLGLPALLVAVADNQIDIAKSLDLLGACIYIGSIETSGISKMRSAIFELLNNPTQIQSISQNAFLLVDGLGVDRVCEKMSF